MARHLQRSKWLVPCVVRRSRTGSERVTKHTRYVRICHWLTWICISSFDWMHECVSGSVDASQSVPLLASDDDVTLHSKDEHQTSSDVTEEESSPNKCVYSFDSCKRSHDIHVHV